MQRENILYYIQRIRDDAITHIELREFIEICIKISLYILNKKHHQLKKLFSVNGIGFEDAAVDAIAPLFIKNDSLNLTKITQSLNNWHNEINTESDAHFFIFKVVTRRTEQIVNEVLSEIDPLFGRLLKNILYKAKSLGYKKVYYSGIAYLIHSSNLEVIGGIMPSEQFCNIPLNIYCNKLSLDLAEIFIYIKNNTNYFPAVPLNLLIEKVKYFYTSIEFSEVEKSNPHTILETTNSVEKALSVIYNKIDKKYIQKKILNFDEGQAMKFALKEISRDLMDGGMQRGLEHYLSVHFSCLDKDQIKGNYRNILDYLIRLLKKEFIKEFKNINFPNS